MQHFDGFEDAPANPPGGRQARLGNSSDRQTSYSKRPFTELVDEANHGMVRRKICATLFGGFRYSVSGFSDNSVGAGLHFCQVLIYLIAPLTIILGITMFAEDEQRILAALVAGALQAVVINLPIMSTSYLALQKDEGDMDDEEISCASKAALRFLFPPKSSVTEMFVCFVLTFGNGALMTYAFHPATLSYFFGDATTSGVLITGLIVTGLSSYCLFSAHCPESAIYRDNDIYFGFGSNHYQRVVSNLAIALAIILIEAHELEASQGAAGLLYWMFLIVYLLQAFGVLSHPVVTVLWAMEQVSEHLFGSTARASDARIVMFFILNIAFVVLSAYLGAKSSLALRLSTVLLSFLASHNLFGSLGMKKAFGGENSRLQQKKALADIVFADKEGQKPKGQSSGDTAMNFAFSLLLMGIAAALAILKLPGYDKDNESDLTTTLVIVAVVLMLLQWTLSNFTRISLWRVIPCPHNSAGTGHIAISNILKLLLMAVLIITIFQMPLPISNDNIDTKFILKVLLLYRALAKVFHNPLMASLDSIVLLVYPTLEALTAAAFCINRFFILMRKLQYVAVSVSTAQSNTKQRFANQEIIFAIQFTILLPITLGVIFITALLDTATVPFLGFAFFIIGYPKPLRGWSEVNPAEANPNDSRSDGHLYQSMMPQLSLELQRLISADPFNFERGSFYFLKNEKMILLVQVLERGCNYVVITVKGTELQETTVCHAEENGRINDETEALFERKERQASFQYSLSPLKQLTFGVYDDVKVSLSGIIENPAFADLVKQAFMRIILLKVRDSFNSRPGAKLIKIYNKDFGDQEMGPGRSLLESNWLDFLKVNFNLLQFEHEMSVVAGSSGQSFNNRVHPTRSFRNEQQRISRDQAFLNSIEGNIPQRGQYREERKVNISQNQGVAAVAVTQSAVPGLPPISNRAKPDQTMMKPVDDLDQILDDLEDLEGGELQLEGGDDLDDLDDLLNEIAAPQKTTQHQRARVTSIRREIDDAHTRTSNNGIGQQHEIMDDWDPDVRNNARSPPMPDRRISHSTQKSKDLNARSQVSMKRSLDQRAPRQQSSSNDLELFAFQAFYLLFGDEFSNMPQKLMKIFKGDMKKEFGNRDFLDSKDINVVHLKQLLLLSARLAFHWSFEAFIMGELELSENTQFNEEVYKIDKEWYLGSEEYLWNSAIERNLPNMERLIQKDGHYFAHQLKFGQSKDSRFSVFEFRREVIRGIWANVNMELLYYTNSNDERFSIQAEQNILRNLLVQLAEIPLGYPVYSSGAKSINY